MGGIPINLDLTMLLVILSSRTLLMEIPRVILIAVFCCYRHISAVEQFSHLGYLGVGNGNSRGYVNLISQVGCGS
jgi:hypothetical protein